MINFSTDDAEKRKEYRDDMSLLNIRNLECFIRKICKKSMDEFDSHFSSHENFQKIFDHFNTAIARSESDRRLKALEIYSYVSQELLGRDQRIVDLNKRIDKLEKQLTAKNEPDLFKGIRVGDRVEATCKIKHLGKMVDFTSVFNVTKLGIIEDGSPKGYPAVFDSRADYYPVDQVRKVP